MYAKSDHRRLVIADLKITKLRINNKRVKSKQIDYDKLNFDEHSKPGALPYVRIQGLKKWIT